MAIHLLNMNRSRVRGYTGQSIDALDNSDDDAKGRTSDVC